MKTLIRFSMSTTKFFSCLKNPELKDIKNGGVSPTNVKNLNRRINLDKEKLGDLNSLGTVRFPLINS